MYSNYSCCANCKDDVTFILEERCRRGQSTVSDNFCHSGISGGDIFCHRQISSGDWRLIEGNKGVRTTI